MLLSMCPSVCHMSLLPSVFSFPDNSMSKYKWIFTKLGRCIDIMEIWFVIVNGQILSVLKELSAHHMSIFSFLVDSFCKCQWIFTKLGMCFDIVEIWFWIANRQISSFFFRVICQGHFPIFISGQ